MAEPVVCSAAEADFAEALTWYAKRSVEAAERFEAEFGQALQQIAESPQRFPVCSDRHRYYLMRKFPYQVIYEVRNEQTVVIAVAHAARRPGFWVDR